MLPNTGAQRLPSGTAVKCCERTNKDGRAIIRGGENISCIEVESAIYAHPAVAEASVFGLPHRPYGEIPAAVFMARPDTTLDSAGLRDFLTAHIAPFKIPVDLWQVAAPLPRLGTEKIDKCRLRETYRREWSETVK